MSTMAYYDVLAGSLRYHGDEPLTYSSESNLVRGTFVEIPLRDQNILGIVVNTVSKPKFKTKPISKIYDLPALPETSLRLMEWLRTYYPAPLGVITNLFLPANLTKKLTLPAQPLAKLQIKKLPALTKDQANAVKSIKRLKANTYLLHGETGSGKTRVYLELAKDHLSSGQDVLILTPEIGLTPQLINDFENAFSHQVIVWHSNLTPAQRRQAWLRLLQSGQANIVIGPRSAMFAPFRNLGLIVIDEAHESAYKQEQQPHYQAIRVAGQLAQLHQAKLIMGTATPNITDYYITKAKQLPVIRMTETAIKAKHKADIKLVDIKDKQQYARNRILSETMLKGIEKAIHNKQQSLVFLNRRGSARLVLCQNCGWEQLCPNCDLPLTYHGDTHVMRCHTCGYIAAAPFTCPICHSTDIIYRSIGTKALVEILTNIFPEAVIKRFDTDNTKAEKLEQNYQALAEGSVDIMVGTQIITKGLDLPKLGFVGVVTADSSLTFPDFTADERTYQLLRQVIGRIGRGHQASQAVVQTYHPENLIIQSAINKNWDDYYTSQIKERQLFRFPPFVYLLKLATTRKQSKIASEAADKLKYDLLRLGLRVEIIGPSPSFYEKSKDGYRWQLVVKAKDRSNLLKIVKVLPPGWSYDLDPTNLL